MGRKFWKGVIYGGVLSLLMWYDIYEAVAADYRNVAYGYTNTTLPGYDAETNPNRTGVVSVSLDLNTARFYLDGNLLDSMNHFCWPFTDGTFRRQDYQYVGQSYLVDIVLDSDNRLYVYLDDIMLEPIDETDPIKPFCEPLN